MQRTYTACAVRAEADKGNPRRRVLDDHGGASGAQTRERACKLLHKLQAAEKRMPIMSIAFSIV